MQGRTEREKESLGDMVVFQANCKYCAKGPYLAGRTFKYEPFLGDVIDLPVVDVSAPVSGKSFSYRIDNVDPNASNMHRMFQIASAHVRVAHGLTGAQFSLKGGVILIG